MHCPIVSQVPAPYPSGGQWAPGPLQGSQPGFRLGLMPCTRVRMAVASEMCTQCCLSHAYPSKDAHCSTPSMR